MGEQGRAIVGIAFKHFDGDGHALGSPFAGWLRGSVSSIKRTVKVVQAVHVLVRVIVRFAFAISPHPVR
jgi:hypothetical protein